MYCVDFYKAKFGLAQSLRLSLCQLIDAKASPAARGRQQVVWTASRRHQVFSLDQTELGT